MSGSVQRDNVWTHRSSARGHLTTMFLRRRRSRRAMRYLSPGIITSVLLRPPRRGTVKVDVTGSWRRTEPSRKWQRRFVQ
ncbi:hypothetical protein KIF59_00550 [Enterobacter cloacae subsp. cloacae]|nr:hypothetical protein [Enterobacter cloacae subsp. cloacae]